jgi:hypothetical protein
MTVPTSSEVLEGLHRIRVRRRVMWIMIVGYIAICLLAPITGFSSFFMMVAFAWFVLTGVSSILAIYSKCPRCAAFFHTRLWWGGFWKTKCINCGLPLGK